MQRLFERVFSKPSLAREKLIEHQLAVSKETLRKWMTELGYGRRAVSASAGCTSRVGGVTVPARWCRWTARITDGSRTEVQNATCSPLSRTRFRIEPDVTSSRQRAFVP